MKIKRITAVLSSIAVVSTMLVPITVSHAEETTLSVGADKQYKTICEAVAKAKEINPAEEGSRVTINVDPGDYEEQVVFDNMKYITLQQTPDTAGKVNLHWYYCTGYAAANVDLTGSYNPTIDWYNHQPKDSSGKTYSIGELIPANTTLTYTDTNGAGQTYKVSRETYLGNTGGLDKMAALIIRNKSENITVKDLNIVNSVPVMATQGEKDAHLTPCADYKDKLPDRSKLVNCTEDTAEESMSSVFGSGVTKAAYETYVASNNLTAGQSVWLARSGAFNERGHAVSVYSGDKITFDGIRLRGGQDSLFCSGDRVYFKNCNLIGGTDYIYGSASAVFDSCRLGLEGFSDKKYGSPIATPSTAKDRKYGYLFFNCTAYNMRENCGANNFGGAWGDFGQVTYYNTTLDDNASIGKSAMVIDPLGWCRFDAGNGLDRLYEYGTKNAGGAAVDLSKRVVNKPVEEGGTGMGTVLDKWQILEFNPRNYFAAANGGWKDDWDPMGFGSNLTVVDKEIAASAINVPEGDNTVTDLPVSSDSNIEYHWASASTNAIVSADGTKLTVVRPAAGEAPIETSVTLYARDKTTGYGDKKDIPVTIAATTDTTNVFNIPVKISQSASTDNNYSISISKNGALIKSQKIAVSGTSADAVIENIPASADGIDYDIRIVSESDEFTIVDPKDGATAVKGVTGKDVTLDITAQKLVDSTQTLDIASKAADGNKTYDIIALAKAAGAEGIESSDSVKLTFDVTVNAKPSKHGYIDISSGTPKSSNSAEAARFTEIKINSSWTQLDSVDCTQGFSGASNGDGQCLNLCGKFSYPCTQTVSAVINYKDRTVSVEGSNTKGAYTFKSFPEGASKGTINMGIFPGSTGDDYEISNVNVTYKKVVTGTEPTPEPTEKPEFAVDKLYDLRANDNSYINATNSSKDEPRGSIDGNAYDLNDDGTVVFSNDCYQSQTNHGAVVWGGDNKIVIKAGGPTAITVGGCAFAAATTVTLKKTDGTVIDSKDYSKTCWMGTTAADNTTTLEYTDNAKADLMVCFDGYTYLPMLEIKKVAAEATPTPEQTEKPEFAADKLYDLRANDNSYINATNSSKDEPRGSIDGNAYDLNNDGTVVFSNDCYQSQTSHGVVVWGGDNKIVIKAGGPTAITVGGCAFAAATTVTLKKTDGTVIDSKAYSKTCWTGTTAADNTTTLEYTDNAKADLMVCFDSYTYLPMLEVKKITKVTAEQVDAHEDLQGDNAASYMATFKKFSGALNSVTWTINKADNTASKTVPEKALDGTQVTDTDIVFGLVITTSADLSTIGKVTAELK